MPRRRPSKGRRLVVLGRAALHDGTGHAVADRCAPRLIDLYAPGSPALSRSARRFRVPPHRALLTLADASGGLSALFALDSHIERHLDGLLRATEEVGQSPMRSDAATRDARALANAQLDSVRALRRELAELAVDAEQALPAGVSWNLDIVAELVHPPLPETFGPLELLAVEASFVNGMTLSVRTAADSLEALRDRLAGFDDDASRGLAKRIDAWLEAVMP